MTQKLTPKQEAFVSHYLANGGNGTDAARKAGYKGSDVTLGVVAGENIRKPNIAAAIAVEREKLKKKTGATAEAKRELLWKLAQLNSAEVISEDGSAVKAVDSRAAVAAIAELNKMDGDLAAIKTDNKTSLSFEEASDDELDRQIAAAVAAAG